MTLEKVKTQLLSTIYGKANPDMIACLDAAIAERDELRQENMTDQWPEDVHRTFAECGVTAEQMEHLLNCFKEIDADEAGKRMQAMFDRVDRQNQTDTASRQQEDVT